MVFPNPRMLVLPPCTGPTPLLLQQKPLSSLRVALASQLTVTGAYPSGLISVKRGEIPGCMAPPELPSGRQITCRRERIQELEGIACKWEDQPKSPSSPRPAEAEVCSWQCTCFGEGWSCSHAMGKTSQPFSFKAKHRILLQSTCTTHPWKRNAGDFQPNGQGQQPAGSETTHV